MRTNGSPTQKIAVFYEHSEWFRPFFEELDRRQIVFDKLKSDEHSFDPTEAQSPYALIFNRMSPSAWTRGRVNAIPYTLHYMAHLKEIGANVINGYDAYVYEFSKARQLGLLERMGVRYPRARVINHASHAPSAAEGLVYPVITKANIGGSGAGITRFDTPEELADLASQGAIDLGIDHTALVQEYLPAQDNSIVRVEVVGGKFLYAIRVHLTDQDSFNLCPADYCKIVEEAADEPKLTSKPLIEGYTPPPKVIETVERIMAAASIEVGGIEYLVNSRDGEIYYYDINAMSNFVADAPNVIGFEPVSRLVDFVQRRAGIETAVLA